MMPLGVFLHLYLLAPYYVLEDRFGQFKCPSIDKLVTPARSSQVAVVTGGTGGIGTHVTTGLLKADMHVILGLRDVNEGKALEESIRKQGVTTGKLTVLPLELASLDSVRTFGEAVLKETTTIHLLLNNGGILPVEFKKTVDGLEESWEVNYLSHFLLTHLLLPVLQSTASSGAAARVVSISCFSHRGLGASDIDYNEINNPAKFSGLGAEARSKLANVMFSLYLSQQLKSADSKVQAVAAYPGNYVNTRLLKGGLIKYAPFAIPIQWLGIYKPAQAGAQGVLYAGLEGQSGQYLGNCRPQTPSKLAKDQAAQKTLFEFSKSSLQITKFGGLF